MRIFQAKLCKTMQYHALPMSSETILDKKVLIVLLLKNSREFHFSISISRHFCFTFHFSKRVNQIWISLFTSRSKWRRFFFHFQFSKRVKLIFISLFTSRSEWKRFLFHFSLLEIPISTLAGHCTISHNCKICEIFDQTTYTRIKWMIMLIFSRLPTLP